MKRLHLFYLSILLFLWGWGGCRWWQWRQMEAATETPEAAFEVLEQTSEKVASVIVMNAEDYPSQPATSIAQNTLRFGSLFWQAERGEQATQVFQDTFLTWLEREDPNNYGYLREYMPSVRTSSDRLSRHLLRHWVTGYFASKIGCMVGQRAPLDLASSTPAGRLYTGETFCTDFCLQTSFETRSQEVTCNAQPITSTEMSQGVDTFFATPGRHAVEVRFKTELFDARSSCYLYVLNHSK